MVAVAALATWMYRSAPEVAELSKTVRYRQVGAHDIHFLGVGQGSDVPRSCALAHSLCRLDAYIHGKGEKASLAVLAV